MRRKTKYVLVCGVLWGSGLLYLVTTSTNTRTSSQVSQHTVWYGMAQHGMV